MFDQDIFDKIKNKVLRETVSIRDTYDRIDKIDDILVNTYGEENCKYGQFNMFRFKVEMTDRQAFLHEVDNMVGLVAENVGYDLEEKNIKSFKDINSFMKGLVKEKKENRYTR